MATNPNFTTTPRLGAVSVSTANSSYTAPTNVAILVDWNTMG